MSRNPYFIGILSAIILNKDLYTDGLRSQSLFYWNPFCNSTDSSTGLRVKTCRNPYFIGILSAMGHRAFLPVLGRVSQSLFYWNPFCNNILHIIKKNIAMSQSLFYWNPFCNKLGIVNLNGDDVAILILLESFLQFITRVYQKKNHITSQSLFYWNPFCNRRRKRNY